MIPERWLRPGVQTNAFDRALDVHLAVGETVGVDVDLLAPEADALIGPIARQLCVEPPPYDRLRLSPRAPHDARELEESLHRVLSVDTSAPIGSEDAAIKEARLHRLLTGLQAMGDHIRARGRIE